MPSIAAARSSYFSLQMIRSSLLLLIAVFYLTVLNARPDFTRFNCHDSESYLALAHSLVNGRGYTRSMLDDMYIPHKVWPPGLPLMMMPVIALSGKKINWYVAKATMAVVGLIGVIAAWFLVRRVTERPVLADLAALLVALNPFYWDFSHQVMTEVPTIVWVFLALSLCDLTFAHRKPGYTVSSLAGVGCGIGMLIKGNLLGLGLAPFAHFFGPRSMAGELRNKLVVAMLFMLGFACPFSAWTLRNQTVAATGFDGINQVRMVLQKQNSNPEIQSASEIVRRCYLNLRTYGIYRLPEQVIPGLWLDSALAWPGSGLLAAGLSCLMLVLIIPWKWRAHYLGLDFVVLPMLALYLPYRLGGAARFWVPISIICMVLLVIRLGGQDKFHKVTESVAIGLAVAGGLAVNLGSYVIKHERQPYNTVEPWKELAEFFDAVAHERINTQGVLTPNMNAFQLMTGYPAPLAHPQYNPSYDYMVARLDRGLQPPEGSVPRVTVFPWVLYRLPEPKTRTDLLGEHDFSEGLGLGKVF